MKDLVSYNAAGSNNAVVANPFGGSDYRESGIGAVQAASHELAEMQAQIYLAKQFPRDQREATEKILIACQRPGLANVAVYVYARGGNNISGPSIRLAEEIARQWGNLECGWNELERNEDTSKLRAFAWDKETNVLKTLFFYVPHYRTTKQGRKRITDERDLYELLANQAARRMRNCILALIPGDVIDAAVEQCEKTMLTHCDITPEGLNKLVEAFAEFGVTKAQIEKRIQRRLDAIAPAQYVEMRNIYNSINKGTGKPEDWFKNDDVAETEPEQNQNPNATAATESLKAALGGQKRASKTRKVQKDTNTPVEETNASSDVYGANIASVEKGEIPTDAPVGLEDELRRSIAQAKTREELEILVAQINDLELPLEVKDGLLHFVDDRAEQIS